MWHLSFEAIPKDEPVTLAVLDRDGLHALEFPCRRTDDGRWVPTRRPASRLMFGLLIGVNGSPTTASWAEIAARLGVTSRHIFTKPNVLSSFALF